MCVLCNTYVDYIDTYSFTLPTDSSEHLSNGGVRSDDIKDLS